MSAMMWVAIKAPMIRRSQIMQAITTISLDIAKSVFQVHSVDSRPLPTEAPLRSGILSEATAVSGRYPSLRLVASLVMRTTGARPQGSADAAGPM
jgi:hypothetical protein